MPAVPSELREPLRQLIGERLRAQVGTTCPGGWGSQTGYRKGCRCVDCTHATTVASKERERRRLEAAGLTRWQWQQQRRWGKA